MAALGVLGWFGVVLLGLVCVVLFGLGAVVAYLVVVNVWRDARRRRAWLFNEEPESDPAAAHEEREPTPDAHE